MKIYFRSGSTVARAILIQVVIAAGLIAWFKSGLPRLRRAQAAEEASKRENKIDGVIQSIVVVDSSQESRAAKAGTEVDSHPQRLLRTPSVDEIKQALGPADGFSGDYRGGVHLSWTGTTHKLEASFNQARLYCLRIEDLRTGHGTLIFESSSEWRPF